MGRETLTHFDVIIIGGGIVGSGIFRDLALHDKSALLLDKYDFNSQTSQGSSKMLHGGIRYLENFDFPLVFEALYEKNLWLKLAPHVTKEIPFYLPVYKESKWPLFLLRIGLFLYDLLSLFKNSPHKSLNKKRTLDVFKGLKQEHLKGAGLYYDGIVDDAKLGLDCIYDALERSKNCKAQNYQDVYKIEKLPEGFKVYYKDTLNQIESMAIANRIVIATGPFTDQFMLQIKNQLNLKWKNIIQPSKGSHLWLKKEALNLTQAMVLQTKDGRIIFVIPQREAILVGTTEIPLSENENFYNIKPSHEEITYLLEQLNHYFPKANVKENQIISSFAAVRPLVMDGHKSAKISRKHKVYSPMEGIFVIAGGKYTTFRKMAQDLNIKLFKSLGWRYQKSLSRSPFIKTSIIGDPNKEMIRPEMIEKIKLEELVRTDEDLNARRLSKLS